jgi:PilZ domain-containing protein
MMDCQTGRSQELQGHNQPGMRQLPVLAEARRHPRFKLQTDIRVYSRSAGLLTGSTVDISESGISAMLKLELSVGEVVELEFELPLGPVAIRALVRHRTAFCYGFQFVEPDLQGVIKATCSRLAGLQGDNQDSAPCRGEK